MRPYGIRVSTVSSRPRSARTSRHAAIASRMLARASFRVSRFALADAAWDGRTFDNPHAVLIPVQCGREFHGLILRSFPPRLQSRAVAWEFAEEPFCKFGR